MKEKLFKNVLVVLDDGTKYTWEEVDLITINSIDFLCVFDDDNKDFFNLSKISSYSFTDSENRGYDEDDNDDNTVISFPHLN